MPDFFENLANKENIPVCNKLDELCCKKHTSKSEPCLHDFELIKVIGKGGYGKVFLVRKTNGKDANQLYAMKIVAKECVSGSDHEVQHIMDEKKIMSTMDSPFLVKMYYAFQTEKKLYLVMEYVRGGELFTRMEKSNIFTEEVARFYLSEIVIALEHLHRNNIAYRDLKPDNIVLDHSGHLKLTDFGLCKTDLVGDELTHTFCGTVEYMSPEMVKKRGHGKAADFWSLGVVMYDMLVGGLPFAGENRRETLELIVKGTLTLSTSISAEAKSLLRRLLTRQVKNRITCEEIKNHTFFNGLDWEKTRALNTTPPFVPIFQSEEDVSFFSLEFTDLPAVDEAHETIDDKENENLFAGFTYTCPSLCSTNPTREKIAKKN